MRKNRSGILQESRGNGGELAEKALVRVGNDSAGIPVQERLWNGGMLRRGNPGNKGGHGRPRDEIRHKLVNLMSTKGLAVLEEILDKDRDIDHKCASCGHKERISPPKTDDTKLKAIALAITGGLGTYKEVEEHKTITLIAPSSLV